MSKPYAKRFRVPRAIQYEIYKNIVKSNIPGVDKIKPMSEDDLMFVVTNRPQPGHIMIIGTAYRRGSYIPFQTSLYMANLFVLNQVNDAILVFTVKQYNEYKKTDAMVPSPENKDGDVNVDLGNTKYSCKMIQPHIREVKLSSTSLPKDITINCVSGRAYVPHLSVAEKEFLMSHKEGNTTTMRMEKHLCLKFYYYTLFLLLPDDDIIICHEKDVYSIKQRDLMPLIKPDDEKDYSTLKMSCLPIKHLLKNTVVPF